MRRMEFPNKQIITCLHIVYSFRNKNINNLLNKLILIVNKLTILFILKYCVFFKEI